ncbi:hypothetical protein OQA88_2582 [Cercophora sp. LCS_1]
MPRLDSPVLSDRDWSTPASDSDSDDPLLDIPSGRHPSSSADSSNAHFSAATKPAKPKAKVVQHISRPLVNRKRKSNSQSPRDQYHRSQRRKSTHRYSPQPAFYEKPIPDNDDEADGDYEEDEYGGDDDEPSNLFTSDVTHSQLTPYQPPQQQPAPAPGTPTALQLFRAEFPHIEVKFSKNIVFRYLKDMPIQRIPRTKSDPRPQKPQNIPSYMMQAVGTVQPPGQACDKCKKGAGIYPGGVCIVVRDEAMLTHTSGACANCWYSRAGSQCTLSGMYKNRLKQEQNEAAGYLPPEVAPVRVPVPPPARETPVPVPLLPYQPPAGAPAYTSLSAPRVHPQYGADLPLAQVHPAFRAQVQAHVQPAAPAALLPDPALALAGSVEGDSLDDKVRGRVSEYEKMGVKDLLATQRTLLAWQGDLTTKLMAMNKVLAAKMRALE